MQRQCQHVDVSGRNKTVQGEVECLISEVKDSSAYFFFELSIINTDTMLIFRSRCSDGVVKICMVYEQHPYGETHDYVSLHIKRKKGKKGKSKHSSGPCRASEDMQRIVNCP